MLAFSDFFWAGTFLHPPATPSSNAKGLTLKLRNPDRKLSRTKMGPNYGLLLV